MVCDAQCVFLYFCANPFYVNPLCLWTLQIELESMKWIQSKMVLISDFLSTHWNPLIRRVIKNILVILNMDKSVNVQKGTHFCDFATLWTFQISIKCSDFHVERTGKTDNRLDIGYWI